MASRFVAALTDMLTLAQNAVLQAMGMTDAFSRQADFSGMTGQRDLFISAVVHQAYVDVNEEGTEATAATDNSRPDDNSKKSTEKF